MPVQVSKIKLIIAFEIYPEPIFLYKMLKHIQEPLKHQNKSNNKTKGADVITDKINEVHCLILTPRSQKKIRA